MISIDNLSVAFDDVEVVKNVSVDISDGEILGIVGESGSGKSVTALTLMGLQSEKAQITSGQIRFNDIVMVSANVPRDIKLYQKLQGSEMTMIFQEPMTSMNPTMKVGKQIEEVLRLHTKLNAEECKRKVLESLRSVGLNDAERVYRSYPHQLSGGMRQRAMIAMAVILEPALIVADEPTTALDVTVQNQIIELLSDINRKKKNSMIFITHDLNLARRICTRIAVMKDGKIVEIGTAEQVFDKPEHTYTRMLMEKVPTRMKKINVSDNNIQKKENILSVKDLNVYYIENSNRLFLTPKKAHVIKDVSFDIKKGEILGLVGESGCGKTTLSKAILGINKEYTGEIIHYSKRPGMIFQDPYSSLNPSKTIGWLLQEPLRATGGMTASDMRAAAYDMLKKVEMDEKYFDRKPSELSGGQRQRISIAQALITKPGLVIADEPVSALDVTIQAQIMELMLKIQQELGLAYLFISHDINVIYQMSHRIMVMKEGKILEIGDTQKVFNNPQNEYTKQLLK